MNDLYVAKDGTIRSRNEQPPNIEHQASSSVATGSITTLSETTSRPISNVPTEKKVTFWILLILAGVVLGLIGSSLFAEGISESPAGISTGFATALIFIGTFACLVVRGLCVEDYDEKEFALCSLWSLGGQLVGALVGRFIIVVLIIAFGLFMIVVND